MADPIRQETRAGKREIGLGSAKLALVSQAYFFLSLVGLKLNGLLKKSPLKIWA